MSEFISQELVGGDVMYERHLLSRLILATLYRGYVPAPCTKKGLFLRCRRDRDSHKTVGGNVMLRVDLPSPPTQQLPLAGVNPLVAVIHGNRT